MILFFWRRGLSTKCHSDEPAAHAQIECLWEAQLTIPSDTIRMSEIAPHISSSVQETGIDGLARTNLRFS